MHVYRRFMGEEPDPEELTAVRCGRDCSRLPPSDFRGPRTVVPRSLEDLIDQVAAELRIDPRLLASRRRDPELVRARTEIARRAAAGAVATLAVVAARLGRAPSTLSELLNRRGANYTDRVPVLSDEPKP